MSSDETLKDMIDKSRKDLSVVQENSVSQKRPDNVCAGHDALFRLVQKVADGVDTTLAVLGGMLSDKTELDTARREVGATEPVGFFATFAAYAAVLKPWRWPAAIAACSPFASDLFVKVFTLLKG